MVSINPIFCDAKNNESICPKKRTAPSAFFTGDDDFDRSHILVSGVCDLCGYTQVLPPGVSREGAPSEPEDDEPGEGEPVQDSEEETEQDRDFWRILTEQFEEDEQNFTPLT